MGKILKGKKTALYIALAAAVFIFVFFGAIFGDYTQDAHGVVMAYGFVVKGEELLQTSVEVEGGKTLELTVGEEREVSKVQISTTKPITSIEVIVRCSGEADRSLGVVNDVDMAEFADSYEDEEGEEFTKSILLAGMLDDPDKPSYKPPSSVKGNYLVIRTVSELEESYVLKITLS